MLERIAYAFFPTLLLESTPWYSIWAEQERRESVFLWRIFFPIVAIIYVGHYFLFDHPMGLQPESLWFRFRMSIAALCIATTLCYSLPSFHRSRHYRIPATAMVWLLCYTQARTIVRYEQSQYLYAFVFVVASAMLLRTSMLKSLVFGGVALASQWPSFAQSGISRPTVISGIVATLMFILITRSKYLSDIRFFLASQQNLDAQRRMIEMNVEFTDRIRAFLPREISNRLTERLSDNRHTVLQAVDEILRPSQRTVACLFSDIRGFTQATKSSQSFLGEGVIPNIRRCNAVIEKYHGIPRKIGDLIFAYYDDINSYVNLVHCISSGLEIAEANKNFNDHQRAETRIRRHVLIANGDAIVGNLGGYDSSIEITALGSPVNLLSRIDEITKLPKFKELVRESDLVLCPMTARLLGHLALGCTMIQLELSEVGARIRDFEEMTTLWLLPATLENRSRIKSAQEYVDANRLTVARYSN
jgi:class 3 adenylate cyclase